MPNGKNKQRNIEATPEMLALAIIMMARKHLDHLENGAKSGGLKIEPHQKIQLFLELLSFYYFCIVLHIGNLFEKDEGKPFLTQTLKLLLVNLPKSRDTLWLYGLNPFGRSSKEKEISIKLREILTQNHSFYLEDDLNKKERADVQQLKNIFGGKEAKTDNYTINLMMKNFYKIVQTLGLSELAPNFTILMPLYIVSATFFIETQKNMVQNIKPVWQTKE